MRMIGALASGETPTSAEANDGLVCMTQMLDSWSAERLTIYPAYALVPMEWLDPAMHRAVLEQSDGAALGRENSWRAWRSPTRWSRWA
jgi:hypothetical protein